MRNWCFGLSQGPGYGISPGFYLTVLAAKATLPTPHAWINPTGEGGAQIGFLAPLRAGETKEALRRAMENGPFAAATLDRKTVIRVDVMGRDDQQFNPSLYADGAAALGYPSEVVLRLKSAWRLIQFRFESFDPEVKPSTDFLLGIVQGLAALGDGVVADPLAMRYLLPVDVLRPDRLPDAVDAREFVAVHAKSARGGGLMTRGLVKFDLPEVEMNGLNEAETAAAGRFLLMAAQALLMGNDLAPGSNFQRFTAALGGLDAAPGEKAPVIELLPPTGKSPGEVLSSL